MLGIECVSIPLSICILSNFGSQIRTVAPRARAAAHLFFLIAGCRPEIYFFLTRSLNYQSTFLVEKFKPSVDQTIMHHLARTRLPHHAVVYMLKDRLQITTFSQVLMWRKFFGKHKPALNWEAYID